MKRLVTVLAILLVPFSASAGNVNEERNPASIDAQIKCAAQAAQYFEKFKIERGLSKYSASMYSHYNTRLNRCIVDIHSTGGSDKIKFFDYTLFDAVEGFMFGAISQRRIINGKEPDSFDYCFVSPPTVAAQSNQENSDCPAGRENETYDALYNTLMKD